ncbi:MAG TPA: HEAT repeat domain-containing protein [Planctomycetota bacterium]|nr:HEAT repeat domain-containing protein [Planctomycetota bacterium]
MDGLGCRRRTAWALALIGLTAASAGEVAPEEAQRLRDLCTQLSSNEPGKKWDAARALVREGPPAVPIVGALFAGEWVEGKRMAAWILSEMRHESAVGPLARALDDADDEVRWKAAIGLKQLGKPSVLHLVSVLLGGTLPARQCAAWTLGEIRDPEAAGPLAAALEEADEDLRWKAAISLTQIGEAALPALNQVLRRANVETRRCAVWAVGKIGGEAALPALAQALADADNHVRAKAVVALGSIQGDAATQWLLKMVNDPDPIVKKDAIVALGRRGRTLEPAIRPEKQDVEPTAEVPLYGVLEVAFKPEKPARVPNPFADASVVATFVAPDDRNLRVAGFYAGDGTWKARAALDRVGLWYYRIDYKAGDAVQVSHGGAKCVPSQQHGFLRIAQDDRRFLAFSDGTRFYPIGTGTEALGAPAPAGAPANTLEVWKSYLEACAKGGMNKCRILLNELPWVPAATVRQHPELSPWPLQEGGGYDLTRFSLPFWDKLDAVIAHGARLGMVFELTMFDETGLAEGHGDRWQLHPFNAMNGGPIAGAAGCPSFYDLADAANRTAQEAYVRYLLARTAACPNVYYELNNQMNRRGSAGAAGLKWVEHWAAFLREHDPYDHLVSMSVAANPEAYFRLDGIDVANVRGDSPPEPHGIPMPVFLSEPTVKGPRAERQVLWQALLLGTSAARAPWQPLAERSATFEHARYLADYARDVAYWELRRDESVVLSTPRNVARLTAVRKGEVFIYLTGSAEGGAVRVGLANGRYEAAWFDPKNGRTVRTDEVTPQDGAVDAPCPTFDEDVLLRIRKK